MDEKTIARFWSKVDKSAGPDGCWLWTGATTDVGYGVVKIDGRLQRAHRVAWSLAAGPLVPDGSYHGTCVCHRCDARRCVNPRHMFLGTHLDNMRDKVAKGRQARLTGEANPRARLTREAVGRVWSLLAAGVTHAAIGRELGVSESCISAIASGRNRKQG